MTYKFKIPFLLPSLNEYIKAVSNNRYGGGTFKSDIETKIALFARNQLGNITIDKPVFINFAWIEKNKKRDLDNVAFAKKMICDSFVKCEILHNDGWAWVVGFGDTFEVDKVNYGVVVELVEVE